MKNNYTYLIVSVFVPLIIGCSSSQYAEGNRFYNNLGFGKAIPLYEKALEDKNIPDAKIKLADSYRRVNNSVKAEYWYSQVVTMPQSKPEHKLFYAQSLIKNGKCDEAAKWIQNYEKENPADKRAQLLKHSCLNQQSFKADSALYQVNKVRFNSSGLSDFSPVYYKEGIAFSSERNNSASDKYSAWTNRPFLDLFYSKIDQNNILGEPQLLKGKINSKYNEGPITFNREETVAYFTRNNFENRKAKKDNDNIVNLKIYKATLIGDEWNHIESLSFNNDLYSNGHPTLSADGLTMYFVSDRPDGLGGTDIYVTNLKDGKWSNPVSLGNIINTPGDEMFPYLFNDTTLYFSSNGLPGMGGLDIYYSIKRNNKWTDPVNIGFPINSNRDDFGYLADASGKTGYFSSNRDGSGEIDNLYNFVKGMQKKILAGLVVEKQSQIALSDVKIEISIKDNPQKEILMSNANGEFYFDLDPLLVYKVTVSKEGYLTQSKEVSTMRSMESDSISLKFELELIDIERPIVLENIYYDFDKWNIRADAAFELDKLVVLMQENPGIKIELSSHADSRGRTQYNQQLTQKRAESVVKYLISKSISTHRMIPRGYGETKLVNGCMDGVVCSEEMHQQNRRTEFRIIEVESPVVIK
ncbi:MAG: OmpA family protein [Bacteroidia bacterium]